jgi:hypothetical protein
MWWVIRTSAGLPIPYVVDASVLLTGMVLLSPMSSKSHFIVLLLPNLLVLGALFRFPSLRKGGATLLGASFALNSLTSRSLVSDRLSDTFLSLGCITVGTIVLAMSVWLVASHATAGVRRA